MPSAPLTSSVNRHTSRHESGRCQVLSFVVFPAGAPSGATSPSSTVCLWLRYPAWDKRQRTRSSAPAAAQQGFHRDASVALVLRGRKGRHVGVAEVDVRHREESVSGFQGICERGRLHDEARTPMILRDSTSVGAGKNQLVLRPI